MLKINKDVKEQTLLQNNEKKISKRRDAAAKSLQNRQHNAVLNLVPLGYYPCARRCPRRHVVFAKSA